MICQLLAVAGVVVGAVVGRLSTKVAPTQAKRKRGVKGTAGDFKGATRSVLKSAIRGGLTAGRAVQTAFGGLREEISDLAAEAKAEIAAKPPPAAAPAAPAAPAAAPQTVTTEPATPTPVI